MSDFNPFVGVFHSRDQAGEAIIDEFEDAWESGTHPQVSDYASRVDFETLIELIHVDLERRIRADVPGGVEVYFEQFPDVASSKHAVELIVEEYRLQSKKKDSVSVAAFVERFPAHRDELSSRLTESELSVDDTPQYLDTATFLMPSEQTGGSNDPDDNGENLPQIPGYETQCLIASGGMGSVFKARDTELNRDVAIKLPRDTVFVDSEGRNRFLREARAAAGLRHPNICPIYQIGEVDGKPFIVLGYVAGCTLKEFARKEMNPRDAAGIVATLARAVQYAHQHHVLHRDIKPANVLIDEDSGQPILTDFGLAKQLNDLRSDATQTGQIMGTPAYMAPEQAAGTPSAIGPAADVYALGAVLFELLIGQPPLTGSVASILTKLQQDSVSSPRKHLPGLHRDLETICLKALAHLPDDRYESATALAEDLERFGRGESILAKPDGLPRKIRRIVRKHRATSLLLLLLIGGSIVATGIFLRTSRLTARTTALRSRIISQTLALDSAKPQDVPEIIRQLDFDLQRLGQLAQTEADGRSREVNAALSRLISNEARSATLADSDVPQLQKLIQLLQLRGEAASADRLDQQLENVIRGWVEIFNGDNETDLNVQRDLVSTSGQGIAAPDDQTASNPIMLNADESLVLLPPVAPANVRFDITFAAGWNSSQPPGIAIGVVDGHRTQPKCMTFSPDGQRLASCDSVSTPRIWNLETRQLEQVIPVGLKAHLLEFSTDGKRLLISGESPGYVLWDIAQQKSIDSGERHAPASFSPDHTRFAFDTSDRLVTVKSMDDGATLSQFQYTGHAPVAELIFSATNTLFVLDWNGRISEWDLKTATELRMLFEGDGTEPTFWRDSVRQGSEYFPQQQLLAAAWDDGTVRVWWSDVSKPPLVLKHRVAVRDFDIDADGRRLLTTANNSVVYVWDIETGKQVHQMALDNLGADRLEVLPSGTQFVASSSTGVSLWSTDGTRLRRYFQHLTGNPFFACHFPTSRVIAGGNKGLLHVTHMDGKGAEVMGACDYELRINATGATDMFEASLLRAETTVHSALVQLSSEHPLSLRLQRLDGHVQAWIGDVDDKPLLRFQEVFSAESDASRRFAIFQPPGTGVESISALERRPSKVPDVWQFANKYYAQGKYDIALDQLTAARNSFGTSVADSVHERKLWQEATYKSAVCLLNLQREAEAVRLFKELSAEPGEPWPAFAVTRLLALAMQADDVDQANEHLDRLQKDGWDFRQLVAAVPESVRDELAAAAHRHFETAANWFSFDPQRVTQLQRRMQIDTLTDGRPSDLTILFLLRALRIESRDEEALSLCQQYSRNPDRLSDSDLIEDLAWILRENDDPSSAVELLNRMADLHPSRKLGFSMELARAEIAGGNPKAALKRCDEVLAEMQRQSDSLTPEQVAQLQLIRGFLLSDLERLDEASDAWRAGFKNLFDTPTGQPDLTNASRWTLFLLLGSLSEKLTAEDLEPRVGPMLSQFTAGTSISSLVQTALAGDAFLNRAKLLSNSLFGTKTPVAESSRSRRFAEQMIAAWQTQRGHELARQIAYLQLRFPDLIRDPALLMASEIAGRMARPEGLSTEEQELLWKLAHDFYDELLVRKSETLRSAMPALGLAWQTTPASAETALRQLESLPDIQFPLAYFMGLRCRSNGNTESARQCFSLAQCSEAERIVELAAIELKGL
ncbi:MAG: serine/threonine-protein kinase [Pirellulaceae bacterium]